MKELEDEMLKKGDIVSYHRDIYGNECEMVLNGDILVDDFQELLECKVIKVERPTQFKTIYERQEEILTEKEKEYLEAVIGPSRADAYLFKKEFINDNNYTIRILNDVGIDKFKIYFYPTNKYSFKGMKINKSYTLEELGLFKE